MTAITWSILYGCDQLSHGVFGCGCDQLLCGLYGVGVTIYRMVYIVGVYIYSSNPERRCGDPGLLPVVLGKWNSSME